MATHQSDLLNLVSQPIGFIKKSSGEATATSISGDYRPLHSGDSVYPFDKVINQTGLIVVEFVDGSRLDMGPGDQTVLNQDVFSFEDSPKVVAEASTDVEAIQQALLAGADPTQVLEPTAAGPAAGASPDAVAEDTGSGGIATISRDGSQTIAANGFNTNNADLAALGNTASELEADEFINLNSEITTSPLATEGEAGTNSILDSLVGDPPELPDETSPEDPPADTTPPSISLDTLGLTNNSSPVISGSAEPGNTITVSVAGQTLITVANTDGSWSVAPSPLADGSHTVAVFASDDSGNQSVEVTDQLTIDAAGPLINTLSFDLPELTEAESEVGQVTATDANGPISYQFNTATDLFSINNQTGVITLTNAGAASSLLDFEATPNLAEIELTATDILGNQTTELININITSVNEAPTGKEDSGIIKIGASVNLEDNLLTNDIDTDGDTLTVAEVNGVGVSASGTVINGLYGDLTVQQDGSYIYQQNPIDLKSDLVAHWTFDELIGANRFNDVATEDVINDQGRLRGNASLIEGGISGKALSLDGSGDYIDFNNSAEINNYSHSKPIGGAGFSGRTISFGFKVDGTDLNSRQVIYEEGGNVRGIVLYIEGGELIAGGYNIPDGVNWRGSYAKVDISSFDTNQWHHVALTLDPANQKLTGYLDGDSFQQVQGDLLYRHPGDISIGRTGFRNVLLDSDGVARVDNSPNFFKGLVDDGLVYNRALTDLEIKVLHTEELTESFSYQLTDGEITDQTNLNITLTDNLIGDSGDNILIGGDDIDFLSGGAGNDSLTGGGSGDSFIWSQHDDGQIDQPAIDIIKDFDAQQGDSIDLSDLLIAEDVNSLDQYLEFNFNSGSTTINVSPEGNGDITQQIILENLDLSSHYGTTDSAVIITGLLDDGHLIVD